MNQPGGARNYWEVLGVAPGAGVDEIKRAYRREAKRRHSDLTRGSDELMRELNEAYAALVHAQAYSRRYEPPAPPPDGPPEPYLTPSTVDWTAAEAEPVTVRLSNRGGAVSTIEPDRTGGAFWAIEESIGVMRGDDLADVVIAPTGLESMPAGTHVDEVTFSFDGRPVKLTIAVAVTPRPPPPPPPPPPRATDARPPSPPPRPPRRHRDKLMGLASVLAFVLFLGVLAAVLVEAANDPPGADATPAAAAVGPKPAPRVEGISDVNGHGMIRQGGQAQWEVLGVDVTEGRGTFSVDLGGSQPAGLESSCVYVGGTKIFPRAISSSRYLQASPEFRSQAGRGTLGPGLEHRHSYTATFPYYGAGSYELVYGCSTDHLPGVDLFTRRDTSRSPAAAVVRGPLYADGVLVVARNVKSKNDQVKLGPIDLFDGGLVVEYRRAGSKQTTDVRGQSCLRRRGKVVASPAGPNQHSLLMATPDNTDIPAARGLYELQFMCGEYEPALPVSGRLFSG